MQLSELARFTYGHHTSGVTICVFVCTVPFMVIDNIMIASDN